MARQFKKTDTIILATHNQKKIIEMTNALSPFVETVLSSKDAPFDEVEETGQTFEENALLKAKNAAAQTGYIAIADDSGFEVPAMDFKPGVRTARWVDEQGGWPEAMKTISAACQDQHNDQLLGKCIIAVAWPDRESATFYGEVIGKLCYPPIYGEEGRNFGFDPYFQPVGQDLTMDQMSLEEKSAISHRGNALRAMMAACCVS